MWLKTQFRLLVNCCLLHPHLQFGTHLILTRTFFVYVYQHLMHYLVPHTTFQKSASCNFSECWTHFSQSLTVILSIASSKSRSTSAALKVLFFSVTVLWIWAHMSSMGLYRQRSGGSLITYAPVHWLWSLVHIFKIVTYICLQYTTNPKHFLWGCGQYFFPSSQAIACALHVSLDGIFPRNIEW